MPKFQFEKLKLERIPLITKWFNMPHVQEFYSLRNWTEQEVEKKLRPYIFEEKPIYPYLVLHGEIPFAYFQYCRVSDFPWDNQNFSDDIVRNGAGLDLFIGEVEFLHRGFGKQIARQFLQEVIWPNFLYCVVDPDVENINAVYFIRIWTLKVIKSSPVRMR